MACGGERLFGPGNANAEERITHCHVGSYLVPQKFKTRWVVQRLVTFGPKREIGWKVGRSILELLDGF